ncbi:MAG: transposase [Chloroflexi bacterium]|nr:transposase [Chloroflexota bacterium]
MAIIPDFALAVFHLYFDALLLWLSDQTYLILLKRDPDHLLVKLGEYLNFTPLEAACAIYHHTTGPGAPPAHPVARLVRALLVKYLYDWSLRDLEWHIRFNLVVKWFVGYPISAEGPDHSTLERFELWVCFKQHRTIFDETLRQIDVAFPDERRQAQVGDTYALRANAAKEPLVQLLRHTCQRLLGTLRKIDAAREAAVRAQFDEAALFGAKDERDEFHLTATERAARLQTTVRAALDCARLVRAHLDDPVPLTTEQGTPVLEWLTYLDKMIADEVVVVSTEHPATPQVTERPVEHKGAYRLGSATDPEATYRVHSGDGTKTDFGYNIQIAATENFVREVQAETGAQPDAVAIPNILQAEATHHDLVPEKLIYDTAAGNGKTRAQVNAITNGKTQLVAPLPPTHASTGKYTPDQFQLSEDRLTLTCPNGQTTALAYASGSGDGRNFRFLGLQCRDCPVWEKCRTHKPGSKQMRQVFISDYRREVETARRYNTTDAFKLDLRQRPRIERIIAALVRYNGARFARRRGKVKCDFQAKMNAVGYNLKKWMRLRKPRKRNLQMISP